MDLQTLRERGQGPGPARPLLAGGTGPAPQGEVRAVGEGVGTGEPFEKTLILGCSARFGTLPSRMGERGPHRPPCAEEQVSFFPVTLAGRDRGYPLRFPSSLRVPGLPPRFLSPPGRGKTLGEKPLSNFSLLFRGEEGPFRSPSPPGAKGAPYGPFPFSGGRAHLANAFSLWEKGTPYEPFPPLGETGAPYDEPFSPRRGEGKG